MSVVEKVQVSKSPELVQLFKDRYADAIDVARVGVEHTNTEGWCKLYADHRQDIQKRRRDLAKRIEQISTIIASQGSNKDLEKDLADCKKVAETIRKAHESFNVQVIHPITEPVDACRSIISDFKNRARRESEDHPLVSRGLLEAMEGAISQAPKVSFDYETGKITMN